MDKKLNVAVVGVGHLGSRHLKVYHELSDRVNLVGVCDVQQDRTLKLAEHYRVKYFKDHRDLIG